MLEKGEAGNRASGNRELEMGSLEFGKEVETNKFPRKPGIGFWKVEIENLESGNWKLGIGSFAAGNWGTLNELF